MLKSKELEEICAEIGHISPDWRSLIERVRNCCHCNGEAFDDIRFIANKLSEAHLDMCLEGLARKHRNKCPIYLDPVRNATSQSYVFSYRGKRVRVHHRISNIPVAEYDKIALVNDLPVVFEVKIARWRERGGRKNPNHLKSEIYNRKLAPIRELVGGDVGYVVVIPRDNYDLLMAHYSSPVFNAFRKNNGLVVPFYATRHEFQDEVRSLVLE